MRLFKFFENKYKIKELTEKVRILEEEVRKLKNLYDGAEAENACLRARIARSALRK